MVDSQLLTEVEALLQRSHSIQLATLNEQGQPEISYAPYIRYNNHFYLYLSGLAKHSQNLVLNPDFSFMVIEDEVGCKQPFARKRLRVTAVSSVVDKSTDVYAKVMGSFNQQFGNVIELLESLPDFNCYEITLKKGSFVLGFGQAYSFEGSEFESLSLLREGQ